MMSIQDVQQQMALMETQGRQEEFVTSAGKLKEDELKMDKFKSNHITSSGKRKEEQPIHDKHQNQQASNFYADPNKDSYWKKMTFATSDKRSYPQHPDAVANSPQKNFTDDRDFYQGQPLSKQFNQQMSKYVYKDPSQIGQQA